MERDFDFRNGITFTIGDTTFENRAACWFTGMGFLSSSSLKTSGVKATGSLAGSSPLLTIVTSESASARRQQLNPVNHRQRREAGP